MLKSWNIARYRPHGSALCIFFCVVCESWWSVIFRDVWRDLLPVCSVVWPKGCRLASSWESLAFMPTSLVFLPRHPPFPEARCTGTFLCIFFRLVASWEGATFALPTLFLLPSFLYPIAWVPRIALHAFITSKYWVARIWLVFIWVHSSVTSFLLWAYSGTLLLWSYTKALTVCTLSKITCNSVLPSSLFILLLSWVFASMRIPSLVSHASLAFVVKAVLARSLLSAVPASSSSIDTPRSSFSSPLVLFVSLSQTLQPSWSWNYPDRIPLCWTFHSLFFQPLPLRSSAQPIALLFFLEAHSPSFWWAWVSLACVLPPNLHISKSTFCYLPSHPYRHICHLNFPWNLVNNAINCAL